jgi:hypothetical protein
MTRPVITCPVCSGAIERHDQVFEHARCLSPTLPPEPMPAAQRHRAWRVKAEWDRLSRSIQGVLQANRANTSLTPVRR